MEFKYFVIVLSIACIIFLYFLSSLSRPSEISIDEITNFEGKQVIVSGIVTDYRTTTYGGQIIEIKDISNENSSNLIVYVEEETTVEYGDEIQATGLVQKYKDDWEVVVDSSRYVKILQKWDNVTFPLWQLANNPNKYIDLNVNVSGFVDRDYESYFYLVDSKGDFSIVVYYDSSQFKNFSEGDFVSIGARFSYDPSTIRFVLYTNEENHSIIVLEGRY